MQVVYKMSVEILTDKGVIKTRWGRFYLLAPLHKEDFRVKIMNNQNELEEYQVSKETFEEIHSAIGKKIGTETKTNQRVLS